MHEHNVPRLRLDRDPRGGDPTYRRLRIKLYDPLMWPLERTMLVPLRKRLLADLVGDGLEVGIGTGLSLRHYGPGVRLVAVEPMAEMIAALARRGAPPLRAIVQAAAESLPFRAHSFDFVAAQFVCCSVVDPARALEEMHRVLKPGGRLRLLEHVRSDHPIIARVQDALAPFWREFAFGCRLNGEVRRALARTRFRDVRVDATKSGLLESIAAVA